MDTLDFVSMIMVCEDMGGEGIIYLRGGTYNNDLSLFPERSDWKALDGISLNDNLRKRLRKDFTQLSKIDLWLDFKDGKLKQYMKGNWDQIMITTKDEQVWVL